MKIKAMEQNTMMISVQCQAAFAQDIWSKYSWSFSQGKHVKLQHKEEDPKRNVPSNLMPRITIHQKIQPLHVQLTMQHLSFSQIAVYKQELLREVKEEITLLQAANESSQQRERSVSNISSSSTKGMISQKKDARHTNHRSDRDHDQPNRLSVQQLTKISQFFTEQKLLQTILNQEQVSTNYENHVRDMSTLVNNVTSENIERIEQRNQQIHLVGLQQPLDRAKSIVASESILGKTLEQQSVISKPEESKPPIAVEQTVIAPSIQMVWHERVMHRQQQWKTEQERVRVLIEQAEQVKQVKAVQELSSNKKEAQPITYHMKSISPIETELQDASLQRATLQVQRVMLDEVKQQLKYQHFTITTPQKFMLQKLRIKDMAQKTIKKIEQKMLRENIKLQYAEHVVIRKRGRPKKENENSHPVAKRASQDVIPYINRRLASVMKEIPVIIQQPQVQLHNVSRTEDANVMTTLNKRLQLKNYSIDAASPVSAHTGQRFANERLPKVISLNGQWMNKLDQKKQIVLVHLKVQPGGQSTGQPRIGHSAGQSTIDQSASQQTLNKLSIDQAQQQHDKAKTSAGAIALPMGLQTQSATQAEADRGFDVASESKTQIIRRINHLHHQLLTKIVHVDLHSTIGQKVAISKQMNHLKNIMKSEHKIIENTSVESIKLSAKWHHKQIVSSDHRNEQEQVFVEKLQKQINRSILIQQRVLQHRAIVRKSTDEQITLSNGRAVKITSVLASMREQNSRNLVSEQQPKIMVHHQMTNISPTEATAHIKTIKEQSLDHGTRAGTITQAQGFAAHKKAALQHDLQVSKKEHATVKGHSLRNHDLSFQVLKQRVEGEGEKQSLRPNHRLMTSHHTLQSSVLQKMKVTTYSQQHAIRLDQKVITPQSNEVGLKRTELMLPSQVTKTVVDQQRASQQRTTQEQSNQQAVAAYDLKRIELDNVQKNIKLQVKSAQQTNSKQLEQPITQLQTHIRKLEEQVKEQQEQLKAVHNPLMVKKLSQQIYTELNKQFKLDQQRRGR